MKVTFDSKGDFGDVKKWLKKVVTNSPDSTLKKIGEDGKQALSKATPRDTGETASGWDYVITKKDNVYEIDWRNTAHPGTRVNVARLIETGHGTRNGGYVPPRPYIKEAMQKSVWKNAGDKIEKEMTR